MTVFVALGIQHAVRMPRIVLSSVAYPTVQYFSTLSHKRHAFRGKKGYLILTLWPWSWTFTVQHTIYVKCEYFMNQEG